MSFNIMKSRLISVLAGTLLITSCQKTITNDDEQSISVQQSSMAADQSPLTGKWKQYSPKIRAKNSAILKTDEYYKELFATMHEGVDPSECSATVLDNLITNYLNEFEFWDFVLFPDYLYINQLATLIDKSRQYFGAGGEYTHLVTKQQKKLESFWIMPDQIRVNGQHNATLNNRDKIAEVFIVFTGASRDDGYYIADQVIAMGLESKVLPETPLLSFDAFASTSNLIVLGDGFIKTLTATGVVDDVVVAGVLSHEWAHQVQFKHSQQWYGFAADERPQTPSFTRQMELEADFFSSYYLTHKRGGVYNWKKVAEFNELFFNLGDCSFNSSAHHGTPRQRLNASKLGYSIANDTKPKGHILAATELHRIFMQNLHRIL